MISKVTYSKFAEKQLNKLPRHIKEALYLWAKTVERIGVNETRRLKGYHDEPLKGLRVGQRSVRLNKAYRVIYKEIEDKELMLISVIEVNKHDY